MVKPRGGLSVMAGRRSPPKALDFFPTPPWGTRAGIELICELDDQAARRRVLVIDPACGEGHMSHVLADHFGETSVNAADVFNYGWGHDVADFLADDWNLPYTDWIITNPPYKAAEKFALLALKRARRGVALLVRNSFAEGEKRYQRLLKPFPPAIEAIFCERLPMHVGRWEPRGSTATAYSWFIWRAGELRRNDQRCDRRWIPPGTRDRLWMPDDVRRFAPQAPAPLFDMVPA